MNNEEISKLNQINQNKMYRESEKCVQSIDTILDNAKNIAERANKNITNVSVTENVSKILQASAKTMECFYKEFPMVNDIFLHDSKNKKCVVTALAMPEYSKKVNARVNKAIKNRRNGLQGIFDYRILHDLSTNRTEIEKTLETLEEILPVMIDGLKANDMSAIEELELTLIILERRIYHLYCFYGYYLNDIGKLEEYELMYEFFTLFDIAFKNLMSIKKA